MIEVLSCFLALYLGMSIGTYLRICALKKRMRYILLPSLFAPLFSVHFIFWCITEALAKRIDKKAPWIAIKHFDDAMFLFVVLFSALSEREVKRKVKKDDYNQRVYDDIRNSYCT